MSAEPVWCLLRVKPGDFSAVHAAFEKAVEQSNIIPQVQKYQQRRTRHARILGKQLDEFPFFGNRQAVELSEYVDDAQLFLDALQNVFFLSRG